jgi:hypothetical protein
VKGDGVHCKLTSVMDTILHLLPVQTSTPRLSLVHVDQCRPLLLSHSLSQATATNGVTSTLLSSSPVRATAT